MAGRTARRTTGENDLVVALTCRWCGQPINLVPSPSGQEVPDVDAFLAIHARCLARAAAEAREASAAGEGDVPA